jgi:hypothetical protein
MRRNNGYGSTMNATQLAMSSGFRPTRSATLPTQGIATINSSKPAVFDHRASPGPSCAYFSREGLHVREEDIELDRRYDHQAECLSGLEEGRCTFAAGRRLRPFVGRRLVDIAAYVDADGTYEATNQEGKTPTPAFHGGRLEHAVEKGRDCRPQQQTRDHAGLLQAAVKSAPLAWCPLDDEGGRIAPFTAD